MKIFTNSSHDLTEAASWLRNSKLVMFPTETFYALGALSNRPKALEEVFLLKNRTVSKTLSLLAGESAQAFSVWEHVPENAKLLANAFWPGPLTLVLPAKHNIPKALVSSYGVGIRVSGHKTARSLANLAGAPLVATSANLSGTHPFLRAQDAMQALPDTDAIVADDNGVLGEKPSTILAISPKSQTLVMLREGTISLIQINKVLALF